MNKKFIITGAPGTGKTSIILEMKKRGYQYVDEISREIIKDQINSNGDIVPWINLKLFSEKVLLQREKQFKNTNRNTYFFDRGLIDTLAYMKIGGLEIEKKYIKMCNKYRYNVNVFYTPIWEEIYQKDNERKENIELAKKIEKSLINTYKFFGYFLIPIPKLEVEKRVDFILSFIKKIT